MKRTERRGFTLLELLVVIAIIVILVSLLASAVFRILAKIPEVQTGTEIAQMSVGLQEFMLEYNLSDPPPSVLLLNENVGPLVTFSPPYVLGDPSYAWLQKVFGKNLSGTGPAGVPPYWVDWNGDGIPNGPWLLEGEQCLVFYLGGIPTAPGLGGFSPQGFSPNSINPAAPGGKRKGPYYPFITGRLKPPPASCLSGMTFPVYIDPWQSKTGPLYYAPTTVPGVMLAGTPYAYFSSVGYNNTGYATGYPYGMFVPPIVNNLQSCQSIKAAAYFTVGTSPIQFTNGNTFQIICAGKDGKFGTTGWSPVSGVVGDGADDLANFSSTLLGIGQN